MTLLLRALAVTRSSSPFPVRSAAMRLVGSAVETSGRANVPDGFGDGGSRLS